MPARPAPPSAPNSLRALLADYAALRGAGRAFAVASVVGVEGSAFRREGARLLVVPDPATDFSGVTDEPHTWGRVPRPETRGSISGGCLEGEVAWHALDAVRTGRARLVPLTSRLGDDDRAAFGLGCGGTVRVLVQPVVPGSPGPLDAVGSALAARRSGVLAVVTGGAGEGAGLVGRHRWVEAGGAGLDAPPANAAIASLRAALAVPLSKGDSFSSRERSDLPESGGSAPEHPTPPQLPALDRAAHDALAAGEGGAVRVPLGAGWIDVRLDVLRPPVQVVVFGTGPDARALVRQAALLGWETAAVGASSAPEVAAAVPDADRALALPEADRAPDALALDGRTAAVVMTHRFERDRALVAALARSPAPFLGLLGSRRRTARLLADLAGAGVAVAPGRLRSPVGLDLGADTPEEIALAVCAEALAHFRGRRGAVGALTDTAPRRAA